MDLIQRSFALELVEKTGLQPLRLPVLASLVQNVPVKTLAYPSGFEYLPQVQEAVLEDLVCETAGNEASRQRPSAP